MRDGRLTSAIVLSLLVVVQLSTTVSAAPTVIVDEEIACPVYIWEGRSVCYAHDITDEPGYCPGLVIDKAELELQFMDDCHDGPHGQPEYVTVLYDGTTWNLGEVDNETYGINVAPSLLADGLLKVRVSVSDHGRWWGDVILKHSTLTVWADCANTPPAVPTPSAVLLAGMGASVVGWLRRRHAL